jgi:hypothetical protein
MIAVKDLDEREMFRFYGGRLFLPMKGYAARCRSRTVAVGGLMLGTDGKVWGFMDQRPGFRLKALYRYTLKLIDWAREKKIPEIRVSRDTGFDTSERLLTRAGFEREGEVDGHEIWVWRNKKVQKNVRN